MNTEFKLLAAILVLCGPSAFAATKTWSTTASTGNWSTGLNWGGAAPVAGDTLTFGTQTSGATTLNNDIAAASTFAGITFNAGASTFTMSGNSITLGGNIQDSATNSETINFGLVLNANRSIAVNAGGNLTLGGGISGVGFGITKTGLGTLTLNGGAVNTYTGTTIVGGTGGGGTLVLDFANLVSGSDLINSSSALQLGYNSSSGGDTFVVKGRSSGATSQTMNTLSLNQSTASSIVINSNGGGGTTLATGAWTRGAQSTLNVDLSSGSATLAASPTMTNSVVSYATVKDATGTGFATVSGGNVVRYTGATALGTSSNSSATNFSYAADGSTFNWSSGLTNRSANTLSIDTSAASGILDLGGASNILTLTANATLVTGTNDFTIQNGRISGGTETIIHAMGPGTLTISGTIGNGGTGTFTKDGAGTLMLAGNNTASYTGFTSILAGTVKLSGAGTLGGNTTINALGTGAVLDLNSTSQSIGGFTGQAAGQIQNNSGSGTSLLTIVNASPGSFGGIIADNNGVAVGGKVALTLNSAGTLSLQGINTYTGNTTISAGTLSVIGSLGGGNYAGSIINSGTFTYGTANLAQTLSGVISGTGKLAKTGSNSVLTLTGSNTYTGVTTINGGTVNAGVADVAGTSGALGNGGNITFTGGALQYSAASAGTDYSARIKNSTSAISLDTNGQNITLAGNLDSTNTGGLTKSGTGILTLSGTNTFTGTLSLTGGTLELNTNSFSSSVTLQMSTGTTYSAIGQARTWSGKFGGVASGGTSTFVGSQNLTFDSLNAATSQFSSSASANGISNTGTGVLTFGGTSIGISPTAGTQTAILAGTGQIVVSAPITNGTGAGANNVTITNSGGVTFSGANTFSGNLVVSSGVLNVASVNDNSTDGVFGNSANVLQISHSGGTGTLNWIGSSNGSSNKTILIEKIAGNSTNTMANINASGAGTMTLSGGITASGTNYTPVTRTLNLGGNGSGGAVISGVISNGSSTNNGSLTLSLTKNGTSTWTLAGVNTYNGTTTVNAGTLELLSGASPLTQTLGALTLAGADVTLKSNKSGVGTLSTTFTTLTARTAGKTGNIVSPRQQNLCEQGGSGSFASA